MNDRQFEREKQLKEMRTFTEKSNAAVQPLVTDLITLVETRCENYGEAFRLLRKLKPGSAWNEQKILGVVFDKVEDHFKEEMYKLPMKKDAPVAAEASELSIEEIFKDHPHALTIVRKEIEKAKKNEIPVGIDPNSWLAKEILRQSKELVELKSSLNSLSVQLKTLSNMILVQKRSNFFKRLI